MFSFFSSSKAQINKTAYDFTFTDIDGKDVKLDKFNNKVIVVVNVASRCGFTYQYEGLQKLWDNYEDKGLVVIGVPTNNFKQEPGSNKEIKDFCENNFGITFPITAKVNVIGSEAHPFYKWAKESHGISAIPKWNFHKIIIDKKGHVSKAFSSITKPSSSKFISYINKKIKN
tara:strand:+ start:869 stop:1384 length:516 start_codon:yes stop_codon:yes gene_type:complete